MARECGVCGNELPPAEVICPYCGTPDQVPGPGKKRLPFTHRTINLEEGRPVVEAALRRLELCIDDGLRNGITVITLIHGYGSSGKGGAIRGECRKMLEFLRSRKIIGDYLPGEEFAKKSGKTRALLQRYPALVHNKNLGKGNPGVTLVFLV